MIRVSLMKKHSGREIRARALVVIFKAIQYIKDIVFTAIQ